MTIKSSGSSLAISEIAAEFGGSTPHSMSEYYSGGDNVPSSTGDIASSGANSMSNFYGTSNRIIITLTISADTNNYNIFSNKGGTYSAGISDVTLVNNARISSSSTGTAAVDTGSGWTSGDTITIDNNSIVVGDGGDGGAGGAATSLTASDAVAGGAGGNAINLQFNTTIDNTGGTISGGGGGGGGGGSTVSVLALSANERRGGDGGGGGFGGGAAGAGGTASGGSNNSNGTAGSAGTVSAAGAGGGSGNYSGGAGGAAGASGTAGTLGTNETSNGAVGAGGAAGKAVNLNGNTATFTATGTRNGAVS